MRAEWRNAGGVALAGARAPAFGRRRRRLRDLDLIVDLSEDGLSWRWWRGVATLSLLCATLAFIAPIPFEPIPAAPADQVGPAEATQYRDLAIAPLGAGSRTGGRMAANALVEPLSQAPDRPNIELFARLGSEDSVANMRLIARLLEAAGMAGPTSVGANTG
jgi:hypothetical protein